eukprot:2433355-Prymnesium_polylepis.1
MRCGCPWRAQRAIFSRVFEAIVSWISKIPGSCGVRPSSAAPWVMGIFLAPPESSPCPYS